jgi:hypothetical protein
MVLAEFVRIGRAGGIEKLSARGITDSQERHRDAGQRMAIDALNVSRDGPFRKLGMALNCRDGYSKRNRQ